MRRFYGWLRTSVPLTVISLGILIAQAILVIAVLLLFPVCRAR